MDVKPGIIYSSLRGKRFHLARGLWLSLATQAIFIPKARRVQTSNFTCAEPNSWRKEVSSLLLKRGKFTEKSKSHQAWIFLFWF